MTAISRRSFLATAARAAVTAPVAAADATPSPRRKFKTTLSCGMVGVAASPREAIDLAARYGFEAVEPSADFLGKLSGDELAALLAGMKAKGLTWGASGLAADFRGSEPAFQQSLKGLPAWAKALQRAGVTRVATWITPGSKTLTYVANFRQHARRLGATARVLGDHGLRLGLEYVGPRTSWTAQRYPFIHTLAEMKDLLAEISRPNVGLLIDSWHWYTAGETAADLKTLKNADVVCCHLNDAPKGIPVDQQIDSRRDLPLATGVIDLRAFLGALVAIGYDGPVVAEPFRPDLRTLPRDDALALVAAAMKKAAALVE